MVSGLHDVVKAAAIFEGGWPKPVWFEYKGRKIQIKKIFYRWREKTGISNIIKFSVYDGDTLYEIAFNTADMVWNLNAFDESPDVSALSE